MVTTVKVEVRFEADRSMTVYVFGPDGPVATGTTRTSMELGRLARAGVLAVLHRDDVDVDMNVEKPPWLSGGEYVRISPSFLDLEEDPTGYPYGQVKSFLPVGGILVAHPKFGIGIFPPEALEVVDQSVLDPALHT